LVAAVSPAEVLSSSGFAEAISLIASAACDALYSVVRPFPAPPDRTVSSALVAPVIACKSDNDWLYCRVVLIMVPSDKPAPAKPASLPASLIPKQKHAYRHPPSFSHQPGHCG
jgi:hypothetical protein